MNKLPMLAAMSVMVLIYGLLLWSIEQPPPCTEEVRVLTLEESGWLHCDEEATVSVERTEQSVILSCTCPGGAE